MQHVVDKGGFLVNLYAEPVAAVVIVTVSNTGLFGEPWFDLIPPPYERKVVQNTSSRGIDGRAWSYLGLYMLVAV